MTSFFIEQSDFILFYYGLAFVLLGITCFAIAPHAHRCRSWHFLGLFGLVHGLGEWLDLAALVIGDNLAFATLRTAVMAGSYVLLMEFARRELRRLGYWTPGTWIYLPLLAVIVVGGLAQGVDEANAIARYSLGLVGSLATSAVFALHADGFVGYARRLAIVAAVAFVLYGIAAGGIVPYAPFWPADTITQQAFLDTTGVPIQFVRGLLASCAALAIWGIWGQKLISEVSSRRYTRFLHRQFIATLAAMAAILLGGWALTEYFGIIHKQHLEQQAQGNFDLLTTSLAGETAPLDAVVRSLGGTPTTREALSGKNKTDENRMLVVLDLDVAAAGALRGALLDTRGTVIVSSDPEHLTENRAAEPYFRTAMDGKLGRHFAFDRKSGETHYFASYPVRSADSKVLGAAVLERSLHDYAAKLKNFETSFFLVDPHGVVALTNRSQMLRRTLWPLPRKANLELIPHFGTVHDDPILDRPIEDGTWTNVSSEQAYVRRDRVAGSEWSLVTVTPVEGIFASRVLGIAITLLATSMALIYIVARERAMHDHVQMDRRLELEELARDLDHKASTDPLTGLANRLKFDEILNREIMRSWRFKTPLSLILYDIDHFKQVNDSYGHQTGDSLLIQLSRFVGNRVRATDLLARWGGEEFAILAAHAEGATAARFAEILKDSIATIAFDKAGSVTCSFGVAQLADGEDALSFVARADKALYKAKMRGRNRVELAPEPEINKGVGSAA
jgi:diguanylate cyclase (GGDEF)-like protein